MVGGQDLTVIICYIHLESDLHKVPDCSRQGDRILLTVTKL